MKNATKIQMILSAFVVIVTTLVVSCTRNLSVPVTATINTPTFTSSPTPLVANTATSTVTSTATYTQTMTNTITYSPTGLNTQTSTSTATMTNSPTLTATAANTNTTTYTSTAANTQTSTSTQTSTDTPPPTNTQTSTMTPTNTVSVPTATPNPYTDFDDFWANTAWPGYGLAGAGAHGGGTLNTGIDTVNYWNWNPVPEGNGSATYTPASASVTLSGGFGTGTGPSQGYYDFYILSVWPNGNTSIGGAPVPLTAPGTTNTFEMQLFCPVGGPVSIEFVQLLSQGSADNGVTPNINFPVPNDGQWHDCVIPLSSFTFGSGSLTHLENVGPVEIQYQVVGPATTADCVLDVGSAVFY